MERVIKGWDERGSVIGAGVGPVDRQQQVDCRVRAIDVRTVLPRHDSINVKQARQLKEETTRRTGKRSNSWSANVNNGAGNVNHTQIGPRRHSHSHTAATPTFTAKATGATNRYAYTIISIRNHNTASQHPTDGQGSATNSTRLVSAVPTGAYLQRPPPQPASRHRQ